MKKFSKKKKKNLVLSIIILIIMIPVYYYKNDIELFLYHLKYPNIKTNITIDDIKEYTNQPYVIINDNEPFFNKEQINVENIETYSPLDSLGRCGVAFANISKSTMPTEERGSIGGVKPTGWHTVKYDIVNDKYLYNRCHLIGYQLAGENANEKNLITCTSYMNKGVMLDYENKIAEYIKDTNNHVLYRVTPMFKDDNLVASGVQMEALSIEDNGIGIKFNIFVYNVQPGIDINYLNGDSNLK